MDMSEPQGRGVAWTEERGTSDEGPPPEAARQARRRLWRGPGRWAGPRKRAGSRADAGSVRITEAERAAVPPAAPVTALTIDALGRKCPIPIIMLAEQIGDVPMGAVVAVLADDPAAYTDIPSWCMMKAHEFAGYQELPRGGWALYIRRRL
jgi:tRNA 2-thiouridine synthesizing protein A